MLSKAKEKFAAWNEARKERAAHRKAMEISTHGHGRFFLLNVPATATVLAAFVEVYWAILFCIEATGRADGNIDWSAAVDRPVQFVWDFAFSGNLPVLLGLLAATAPIVMISMVWLPVQFAMRGFGRWRRGTLIAVGLLCNAIVIISGTVVMNANRQDQVREALVVEQQAGQNRAAIQAQIDAVNADLARLTDRRVNNEYAATAANVGAEAYQRDYMSADALARSPEQRRDIIMRALGAARQADALREQRTALIGQLAAAPTAAAVAPNVEDIVGRDLNAFSERVKVWRPPLIAVACTLIGILGAWWTLAMMMGLNPKDVLRSGWADDAHRIEDLRDDEPVKAQPMKPPREVVTDAETGEELVKVKPREYWRKRKGKPQRVEFEPEIPPDETGVAQDGGGRIASVAASDPGEIEPEQRDEEPAVPQEPPAAAAQGDSAPGPAVQSDEDLQPEPSEEIPAEDMAALELELEPEPPVDAPLEEPQSDAGSEDDGQDNHDEPAERDEPETDPAKLIAAE